MESSFARRGATGRLAPPEQVMLSDIVFNFGWLFFAAWSAIVTAISLKAFGSDLLAPETKNQTAKPSAPESHPARTASH